MSLMVHRLAIRHLLKEEAAVHQIGHVPALWSATKHGNNLDKQRQQLIGPERAFVMIRPTDPTCSWNA